MIECPKCKKEMDPVGNHEDDVGEWNCKFCDFEFIVEIEYDPDYYSSCKIHEFGDWTKVVGVAEPVRFCKYCNASEIKQ